MKKIAFFFVVILVFGLVGCCAGREAAFADGVEQYAVKSGLLAEYDAYIDADPNLKSETKRIRKDTSAGLRRLIDEEKRAIRD